MASKHKHGVNDLKDNVSMHKMHLESMLIEPGPHRPKPYENRGYLYLMHFFFAFVSRMWDFGIILLVAQLTENSLFLIAITGLCSSLSIFLFMSSIGQYLDKSNRLTAVRLALAFKVVAVSCAYLVCTYLNYMHDSPNVHQQNFNAKLIFALPFFAAMASLSFSAIVQSVEKDWIVVLSAKDSEWLAVTNSTMTQIDLSCSCFAPAITGFLFAYLSHTEVSLMLLAINATSAAGLYLFMSNLYNSFAALGQKIGVDVIEKSRDLEEEDEMLNLNTTDEYVSVSPSAPSSDANSNRNKLNPTTAYTTLEGKNNHLSVPPSTSSSTSISTSKGGRGAGGEKGGNKMMGYGATAEEGGRRLSQNAQAINTGKKSGRESMGYEGILALKATTAATAEASSYGSRIKNFCCHCNGYFNDFIHSGCAGVMISYACLYLTVLSFGSLMTVYTRWCGVSDAHIGLFRGLNAIMGYLGALIFPWLNRSLGLYTTAQIAIVYQFLLVATAATSFWWSAKEFSVYVIIVAVLLSRAGLWLFDLCARQIAQESIPEHTRGKVNGQWRSLIAFFDMSGYACAVAIPDPQHFWILTSISGTMIGIALVIFTWSNPGNRVEGGICEDKANLQNDEKEERGGGYQQRDVEGQDYILVPSDGDESTNSKTVTPLMHHHVPPSVMNKKTNANTGNAGKGTVAGNKSTTSYAAKNSGLLVDGGREGTRK